MASIKDGKGTICLAVLDTKAKLVCQELGRPKCGKHDVKIDVKYCGMCHSDLHACNGDWGLNKFPMTPGHEIAGIVTEVGSEVTDYKKDDCVGVGVFVDSCGDCDQCKIGQESYCPDHVDTYGTPFPKGHDHDDCAGYHTNGGYSSSIVVKDRFVYRVPEGMDMKYVGPLLCAGITMYQPLKKHVLDKGGKGKQVGIVGFGGLGQMGVKLAKAMGAEVTVLSRSTSKKDSADKLGAHILAHTDEDAVKGAARTLDVILDTVSEPHELQHLMSMLKVGGSYVAIGAIQKPVKIVPMGLILANIHYEGSLVGGVPETQEMLEFCQKNNVLPEIRVIHAKDASKQFKALQDGSAGSERAVIDMSTITEMSKDEAESAQ